MPFPHFEDLFELSSHRSSSYSADNAGALPEAGNISTDDLNDTTIGSESVLSFQEAMSIDSGTLQDFGSIVSLPAGTLAGLLERHWRGYEGSLETAEDCTRSTIVSSAASGAQIPQPTPSQDMWAVSPHPHWVVSNDMREMSTVCTDTLSYQRLIVSTDEAASMGSSEYDQATTDLEVLSSSNNSRAHQRAAFEAIANRLLQDVGATGNPRLGETRGEWFSRFTDADWEQMRELAKVLLFATGTDARKMLLPLPPSPPEHTYYLGRVESVLQDLQRSATVNARDLISSSFICPSCNDIIVGAVALDCGCTLCAACWDESGILSSTCPKDDGYVWVNGRECTHCGSKVNTTIPCHTLDVAICKVVENLENTEQENRIQRVKLAYYSRLEAWRETVVARNESTIAQRAMHEDEMLARLIEEEEGVLWRKDSQLHEAPPVANGFWLLLCQAAVAVLAGTMSSVALHALARRR